MAQAKATGFLDLPNELLITILSPLPTLSLLPLTPTCFRLHDLILRILRARLTLAASLPGHKLILECFHPASKYSEPYLYCSQLGTPGLLAHDEECVYEKVGNAGRLRVLRGLYTRFKPLRNDPNRKVVRNHPAGGALPERALPSLPPEDEANVEESERDSKGYEKEEGLVAHLVSLDPGDSFSQLCVNTNLVKLGPRPGVFENLVNVSEGLVRIWRKWLADKATAVLLGGDTNDRVQGVDVVQEESHKRIGQKDDAQGEPREERTLWLDNKTNIGLTVRVQEKKWRRMVPVLLHRDEEPAVSYKVEYEELLIRTTGLLLAVEEIAMQDRNEEHGKAMVFGAFVA